MKCSGCGNTEAYRIRKVGDAEVCNECGGLSSLKRDKKTGFMSGGKLLHKNPRLARQVRQTYRGDSSDEG